MNRALFSSAFAAASLAAVVASAQDLSRAQALFDEGRRLMNDGKLSEACPKLAASNKLDPGSGTLMNLGTCYERNNQLASAWATFKEAAALAKSAGHFDRESAARERADKLEPDLPRLSIVVKEPAKGIVIDRDGAPIDAAEYATPIPIDPGPHTLHASAPGKKTWTTTLTIAGPKAQASVTVPALEDEPVPVVPPPGGFPAEPPRDTGNMQRTLGIVAGGAGLVGIGLGVILGLKAHSTYDDGSGRCNAAKQCPQSALDTIDTASTQATISTIGFVAGGIFLAGGVVLYATAPHATSKRGALPDAHVSLGGPGDAGMTVGGSF